MPKRQKPSIPEYAREKGLLTIYVNDARIELLERLLARYPEARSVSEALFKALEGEDTPDRVEANAKILHTHLRITAKIAAGFGNEEIAVAWHKLVVGGFLRSIVHDVLNRLDADPGLDSQFSTSQKRALREMRDADVLTGLTPDQEKTIMETLRALGPWRRIVEERDTE